MKRQNDNLSSLLVKRQNDNLAAEPVTKENKSPHERRNTINSNSLPRKVSIFAKGDNHYANTPMQYTAIFHGCKNHNFQMKKSAIFLIFSQNIDCGYTLEPLVGCKGVFVTQTCFRDVNCFHLQTCLLPRINFKQQQDCTVSSHNVIKWPTKSSLLLKEKGYEMYHLLVSSCN